MPRIDRDPTNDVAPPDAVIEAALPSDMTPAQRTTAVQAARTAWQDLHKRAVDAWNLQVEADAAAARQAEADAAAERQRIEDARAAAQKEADEAERAALEAKRVKFKVDETAQAPAYAEIHAPMSARDDIRKGKFVNWHLFTPERGLSLTPFPQAIPSSASRRRG